MTSSEAAYPVGPESQPTPRLPLPDEFFETGEHYAYCKAADCPGCLPSDAALQIWADAGMWLDLGAEMLRRCIAQRPDTKTAQGALAAIREKADWYREISREHRAKRGLT